MLLPLLFKTKGMQSEKLSEGKGIDIKEHSDWDGKEDDVPEVTPAKNFTIMELSEILQNIDAAKNKTLLADPKGERSMTIHQDIEKMLAPFYVICQEEKGRHYFWTMLGKIFFFYKDIKTFILNVSNILNHRY